MIPSMLGAHRGDPQAGRGTIV